MEHQTGKENDGKSKKVASALVWTALTVAHLVTDGLAIHTFFESGKHELGIAGLLLIGLTSCISFWRGVAWGPLDGLLGVFQLNPGLWMVGYALDNDVPDLLLSAVRTHFYQVCVGSLPQAILQWLGILYIWQTGKDADAPIILYLAAFVNVCSVTHGIYGVWKFYSKRDSHNQWPDPWVVAFWLQYTMGVVVKVLSYALLAWACQVKALIVLAPGFLVRLLVAKLDYGIEENAEAVHRALFRMVFDFYMVEDPKNLTVGTVVQSVEVAAFLVFAGYDMQVRCPPLMPAFEMLVTVIVVCAVVEKVMVTLFKMRYKRKPGREIQGLQDFWQQEGAAPVMNCSGEHGLVAFEGEGHYICTGCKEKPQRRVYGCKEPDCSKDFVYCTYCAAGCFVVRKNWCCPCRNV